MTADRVAPQPPPEPDGEPRWGGQQRITYLARADSLARATDLPPDSPPIGPSSIDDYRAIVRRLARLVTRLKQR